MENLPWSVLLSRPSTAFETFFLATEAFVPLPTDAHTLLRVNLESGRRRTVPGGYAAYDRRGRACRRCGSPISSGRIGRWQRTAYWCPHCQALPDAQTRGQ